MCGRCLSLHIKAVEEIIRDIERNIAAREQQGQLSIDLFSTPGMELAIILSEGNRLRAKKLRWGLGDPRNKRLIYNARFETATGSANNRWADSLNHRRCIVPTHGFFEPHATEMLTHPRTGRASKQQYLFTASASSDSPFLFLAGIYERDCFAIMTTEPNASVRPIHNRMPLTLQQSEVHDWLFGDYLALANRDAICLDVSKVSPAPSKEPEQLQLFT